MLRIFKREFECPHCHNTFTINERISINVTLDPGLKNKVLKGKIFRHTCPNCQQESMVLYNTMYHDMEKHIMIYFMIGATEREYRIPIGANNFGDFAGDDYALRLEVDYNGFRERVRMLDMGFNDLVLEIMRALVLKELQQQLPEAEDLYFIGAPEGNIRFQVIAGGKPVRSLDVPVDMYSKVEEIFKKFPEATEKVNALRRIDRQWLEETGILERMEKIINAE